MYKLNSGQIKQNPKKGKKRKKEKRREKGKKKMGSRPAIAQSHKSFGFGLVGAKDHWIWVQLG